MLQRVQRHASQPKQLGSKSSRVFLLSPMTGDSATPPAQPLPCLQLTRIHSVETQVTPESCAHSRVLSHMPEV